MKYGFFDDARKEYVITTPRTPLPWIKTRPAAMRFTATRACAV